MRMTNTVTIEALQRVFFVSVGNFCGTGFIVDTTKKNYLVTAKHLFEDIGYPKSTEVYIKKGKDWESIDNVIHYHSKENIDVAVIETSYFNEMKFEKLMCGSQLILSQEVFMLGFPYQMEIKAYDINRGYPIPLVKKGIVSGFSLDNTSQFLIDWDNNQGFSGGPVIFRKVTKDGYSEELYIAGIIKGYRLHPIEIEDENGRGTGRYVSENSGIGIAHSIQAALQIIKSIEE